jgi:hypothetical protein
MTNKRYYTMSFDKAQFKDEVKESVKTLFDEQLDEAVKNVKESEDSDYDKFFQSALDKFGVDSPDELDDDKEKEFYDYVDKNWEADNEEDVKEEVEVEVNIEDEDEDEDEDDEEEDDEEEDDEEEPVNEAMKVTATRNNSRGQKPEKLEVRNVRELNKLAKTGQYGYFMVTKANGDEEEYNVDERTNKLVLM